MTETKLEPCEDAISRDAVMGLVAREHSEWDDLYIDIAKLPSVTPSRRKGHWIKKVDFGNCVDYVCSNCFNEGTKDYCPNCGAEMESYT